MDEKILKTMLGVIVLELGDSVSFTAFMCDLEVTMDALETWYSKAVSGEAGAGDVVWASES